MWTNVLRVLAGSDNNSLNTVIRSPNLQQGTLAWVVNDMLANSNPQNCHQRKPNQLSPLTATTRIVCDRGIYMRIVQRQAVSNCDNHFIATTRISDNSYQRQLVSGQLVSGQLVSATTRIVSDRDIYMRIHLGTTGQLLPTWNPTVGSNPAPPQLAKDSFFAYFLLASCSPHTL